MDRGMIRRVAARHALQEAMGDWQPSIPGWLVAWADARGERRFTARNEQYPEMVTGWPRGYSPREITPEEVGELNRQPAPILNPRQHELGDKPRDPRQDTFEAAKVSVLIMLPQVLKTLSKKFNDKFYMNSTQQKHKLYYYFSGHPALETVALTISIRGGYALLWIGYIPQKLTGGSDLAKSIHESVVVTNPELAGLACMRLLRTVLAKVP
jgi:hypothetical protein